MPSARVACGGAEQRGKRSMQVEPLEGLRQDLRSFFEKRDWRRFHAPKNIVMSLVSESAELMQIFRWMSEEGSWSPAPEQLEQIQDEIGDVLINLVALCDELGIDLVGSARNKLVKIGIKHPIE